jgi:hypothetical protein
MIQIGTICISEPTIPSEYDMARHSLFIMESNVHRMKYMMETSVMSIQKKSGKNLRRLKYY